MRLRRRPAQPARPARPSRLGAPAAELAGTDPAGAEVRRTVRGGSGPVLLLFLTSSCEPCQGLWRALAAGQGADLPGGPRTVVVTPGAALEDRRRVAELAPEGVPVVMSGEAWEGYSVPGSPFAVVVRDGRVADEGPVLDWAQLGALLRRQGPSGPAAKLPRAEQSEYPSPLGYSAPSGPAAKLPRAAGAPSGQARE